MSLLAYFEHATTLDPLDFNNRGEQIMLCVSEFFESHSMSMAILYKDFSSIKDSFAKKVNHIHRKDTHIVNIHQIFIRFWAIVEKLQHYQNRLYSLISI